MHSFFFGVAVMFPARVPVNIAKVSTSRNRFEDIRHSPVCGMWARDCAGVWSNVGLSVKK